MIKKSDVSIEYLSSHLKILGSVIKLEESDSWYDIELENTAVDRVWAIKAQLRFYDKHGTFIGFEEDDHESYLEPSRKIALSIFANPPEDYDQVRLTIDASVEEKESSGFKDYLIAMGVLVIMVAGVAVYNFFKH